MSTHKRTTDDRITQDILLAIEREKDEKQRANLMLILKLTNLCSAVSDANKEVMEAFTKHLEEYSKQKVIYDAAILSADKTISNGKFAYRLYVSLFGSIFLLLSGVSGWSVLQYLDLRDAKIELRKDSDRQDIEIANVNKRIDIIVSDIDTIHNRKVFKMSK